MTGYLTLLTAYGPVFLPLLHGNVLFVVVMNNLSANHA